MVPLVCSSKLVKSLLSCQRPWRTKECSKIWAVLSTTTSLDWAAKQYFLQFLNILKVTLKDRNLLQVLMTASGPTFFGRQQSEALLSSILHPDSTSELTRSRVRTCWGGGCPGWGTGTDITQTVRHSQGTYNQKTRLKNTEYVYVLGTLTFRL